ncbi:MAG: hypothetical protein KAT58_03830 [candidate division Zixibacteria bacterium]|nr:hypothetical protein [candidate division Zixibacteria bacterium]
MSIPSSNGVTISQEIDSIERKIDEYPLKNPIMKQPLQFSLWNVLSAHEHYCYSPLQDGGTARDFTICFDHAKYALKYAFNWLHENARAMGSFSVPKKLKDARMREAVDLFTSALEYEGIVNAFTVYRRDGAKYEMRGKRAVRFLRDKTEARYDVLDRQVFEAPEPISQPTAETLEVKEVLHRAANSALRTNENTLRFSLTESDYRILSNHISKNSDRSFLFPKGWHFQGISIETFRLVWVALKCFYETYRFCFLRSTSLSPTEARYSPLVIHVQPIECIVKTLHSYIPCVEKDMLAKIMGLLTYNRTTHKPDPALQPLIPLRDALVGVAPHLVVSSRFERNTITLLSRSYKDEYDKTTGLLEDDLLCELGKGVAGLGFDVVTRISFPQDMKLPDLDLSIFDRHDNIVLLVEVKWVIQPSEVSETYSRAATESKGIEQVTKLLNYGRKNPSQFWERLFPNRNRPTNVRLCGCVCMRGFVGTARNFTKDAPTIEQSVFCAKLREVGNLKKLITWMEGREFLPVEDRDFRILELPHRVGPYTVYWPSYELLS